MEQEVFVIHKVDTVTKHNYPPVNGPVGDNVDMSTSAIELSGSRVVSSTPIRYQRPSESIPGPETSFSSAPPYRNNSHFGFICPLTTEPSIPLHPGHQSIWRTVAEQREKVVSFINLATLSMENRKLLSVMSAGTTPPPPRFQSQSEQSQSESQNQSFISEKHIQLEQKSPKRKLKQRELSMVSSSGRSLDESLEEMESMLSAMTLKNSSRSRADPSDSGLYRSYTFLPNNHDLPDGSGQTNRDRPEAEQEQMFADSGMGDSSGRRQRLATTSNESSTQEAEAYTSGKHVKLTLSSSPTLMTSTPSTIEILINVTLRNAEGVTTEVPSHEQEFRAKLERIIDEEINYIGQNLAFQRRRSELIEEGQSSTRAPLATPSSSPPTSTSSVVQRSNSAPALCHTYSYVALPEADMLKKQPESPPMSPEGENLKMLLGSLEKELERLLNSVVKAWTLHNKAIIHECRARISQMKEGFVH